MNLKNLRRLRRRLLRKEQPVRFDMEPIFEHNDERFDQIRSAAKIVKTHSCGTAACLAGHAALEAVRYGDIPENSHRGIWQAAIGWLGLNGLEARNLFHGYWGPNGERPVDRRTGRGKNLSDLTKAQAIKELDRLIEAARCGEPAYVTEDS